MALAEVMGDVEIYEKLPLAENTWDSADNQVRKALDQFPEGRKKHQLYRYERNESQCNYCEHKSLERNV